LCGSKPTVGVTLLTSPPRIAATSVDLPAPSPPSMMSVRSLALTACGGSAGATFSLRRRARLRPMRFLSGSLAARCMARSSSTTSTVLLQPRRPIPAVPVLERAAVLLSNGRSGRALRGSQTST